MKLLFQPQRYPRTMTRAEWYKNYRWVRQTRKELETNEQKMLAAALVCGNDRIKRDIMDQIIMPPLLVVPDIEQLQSVDLRPGQIIYFK